MLRADECQLRADEFGRLADTAMIPDLAARYRRLQQSWLYLVRMKLTRARQGAATN